MSDISPYIAPENPRMGNALTRWIGRTTLRLMNWKIVGKLPDEPKGVLIGMPHTSNADLFLALGFMLATGIRFNWMMKKEAFFFPVGYLFKAMNGIPVDRSKKTDLSQQMVEWFEANDKAFLTIAPEGTRSKVKRLKSGFLRIAYAANVPVTVVGLHKPTGEIRIQDPFPLTGDLETDIKAIKDFSDENFIGVKQQNA